MTEPTKKHTFLFAHILAKTPFMVPHTFFRRILSGDTAVDDASAPLADRLEAGAGGRFCLAALAFWFVAPTARYRANETEALALVLWLWARRGAAVDAGLARAALAEARALRRVADLTFDGVAGDKKTRALRLVSHAAKDLNASLLVGAAPGPLPLRGLHAYVGHVAEAGAILAAAESAEAAAAEREALLLDALAPPSLLSWAELRRFGERHALFSKL